MPTFVDTGVSRGQRGDPLEIEPGTSGFVARNSGPQRRSGYSARSQKFVREVFVGYQQKLLK
jgi:hypothetical protein